MWQRATLRLRFKRRAAALEAALLSARTPAVHAAMQEANILCMHLSAAAVPRRGVPHQQYEPAHEPVSTPTAAALTTAGGGSSSGGQQRQDMLSASGGTAADCASDGASNNNSSANKQLLPGHINPLDFAWHKSSSSGQWHQVQQQQQSGALRDAAGTTTGEASAHQQARAGDTAAATAALVEELAAAARGLMPPLSSSIVTNTAPLPASTAGQHAPAVSVQEQLQAAAKHSAQLLKVLCGALPLGVSFCCVCTPPTLRTPLFGTVH